MKKSKKLKQTTATFSIKQRNIRVLKAKNSFDLQNVSEKKYIGKKNNWKLCKMRGRYWNVGHFLGITDFWNFQWNFRLKFLDVFETKIFLFNSWLPPRAIKQIKIIQHVYWPHNCTVQQSWNIIRLIKLINRLKVHKFMKIHFKKSEKLNIIRSTSIKY